MKNFTRSLAAAFLFVITLSVNAQQRGGGTTPTRKGINTPIQRCGTDEYIRQRIQTEPAFRALYEKGLQDYQRSLQYSSSSRTDFTSTLSGPVTIPVVVHIVLPDPALVTDADVLYFINRITADYSGFNSDSTNGSLFYSVRGHSLLRFTLAKRDPSGNFTSGIERRVGAGLITGGSQPIKSFSSGGLDPWDITQYYNLWVGVGQGGLLGIAPTIGVGDPSGGNADGVCVDYRAFSRNPCYSLVQFALARTAVHEIGHNFGLYHIWGDGSCAPDFKQLLSASCQLPDSLSAPIDDTPQQSGPTSGCPAGAVSAGCAASPLPPGKMYQNYMDYTDDPCYSMLTKGQNARMHWVLEYCRPGYLTTLGGTPPASAPVRDAALSAVVRPGGSELLGVGKYTDPKNFNTFVCTSYANPTCAGTITPKVRFQNRAGATLTSVTIQWTWNGNPQPSLNLAGLNLGPLEDTVVTLSPVTLVANNTLKFWTSNPNGGPDQNNTNDTITKVLNFSGAVLPLAEGFEGATFPPAGWSIVNPNSNNTWVRAGVGNASTGSAFIDNYSFPLFGQTDDIVSPPVNVAGLDSLIIEWDLAKQYFPGYVDRFDVLVSTNCGASYTQIWTRSDPALATAGASGAPYTSPGPADWRRQYVSIGNNIPGWGGQVIVAFRMINGYGNNLFMDNINIRGFVFTPNDLGPTVMLRPQASECTPLIVPQITVKNSGTATVNNLKVGYRIDNGAPVICATVINQTIAPGASANVTFPAGCFPALSTGVHTVRLFTNSPNGSPDLFPSNDTIVRTVTIKQLFTSVSENFDASVFPPPTLQVNNPNSNVTWVRDVPGRASAGGTEIDNYNFNLPGQIDDLQLIPINTNGVDSVILTFDVAHKNFPGLDDILSVIGSTDCGNTFSPTSYSKPGFILATAGSSTAPYGTAGPGDWRTERVALGGAFMSTGNLTLVIRNTNGYGNFIHIDNINVTRKFKRDLKLVSINQPKDIVCTAVNTPSVTVQNVGSETITGYNVSFTIDGGAPSTTNITGVTLAPNAFATVNLNPATFTAGPHTFTVYTSGPVSFSGTGDLNTSNDTLRKTVTLVGTIAPPITEGFESTTFPPTGWAVVNPDNAITWRRTTAAASTGVASAYVNNFNYSTRGAVDELYTPQVTYTGVDSVHLKFDVAALTYSFPGSTTIPLDTLEVLLTKDCGNTFTSIYKKWGNELQTINDPNYSQPNEFFPSTKSMWRTESIDLTGLAAGNGPLQVVFRNTNNYENNIFLDNVNLTTRTLPARLKQEGLLVLPSPFNTQFTVWHYLQPTDLKFISVYNSAGQLVWRKDFSGDADKQVVVDLSTRSAGVYIVHLGYTDSNRNSSIRIVKY